MARVLVIPLCFLGVVRRLMKKLITNMLVSKLSEGRSRSAGNNRIRLEAARRTIEELEGSRKDNAAS